MENGLLQFCDVCVFVCLFCSHFLFFYIIVKVATGSLKLVAFKVL